MKVRLSILLFALCLSFGHLPGVYATKRLAVKAFSGNNENRFEVKDNEGDKNGIEAKDNEGDENGIEAKDNEGDENGIEAKDNEGDENGIEAEDNEGDEKDTDVESNDDNKAPAKTNSAQNAIIESMLSPFEDITEFSAFAVDEAGMKKTIAEMGKITDIIDSSFSPKVSRKIKHHIKKINLYFSSKKYIKLATEAMDTYKLIISKIEWTLRYPIEIGQLDYVGFRMKIFVKRKYSWKKMSKLVSFATKNWKSIKGKVSNNNLVDTEEKILEGLTNGVKYKNLELVNFAADMQLEIVDLLENYFIK